MGVKSRGVARKGGDQYAKGKARPSNAAGEGSSSQFPPKKVRWQHGSCVQVLSTSQAAQESIFNLKKYLEKKIQIKFLGGREGKSPPFSFTCDMFSHFRFSVVGILKGYDALNFVIDETEELMPSTSKSSFTYVPTFSAYNAKQMSPVPLPIRPNAGAWD